MNDSETALSTQRIRLSAGQRNVYPALTFEASRGSVVALLGASGTGKTALLLTIAGRMRGWQGSASVCGLDLARDARRVRERVGLALMPGVNDLAEALTPAQHVTEAHVFVPRRKRGARVDVLELVGLDSAADVQVKFLDAEQRMRLGIALALVRDIAVLVVDDLDRDLNREERTRITSLLRALAADGLTVVAACIDDSTAADVADLVVDVEDAAVRVSSHAATRTAAGEPAGASTPTEGVLADAIA